MKNGREVHWRKKKKTNNYDTFIKSKLRFLFSVGKNICKIANTPTLNIIK